MATTANFFALLAAEGTDVGVAVAHVETDGDF